MIFERQTGQTRYLQAGEGSPVVLLHAFPLGADMWRPQLHRVPDGSRFIAPDLRGFGAAGSGKAASMDDMAAGVLEFLDTLQIKTAVIGGLSMGGYVTFALLRRAPDRFHGLILADTRATADNEQGRAARMKMLDTVREKGVSAVVDEMLPKLLGATSQRERLTLADQVRGIALKNSSDAVAGAVEAMRDRPDSTPLLPAIEVPTLVLVGEEDTLTPPSDSQAMAAAIPQAKLVTLAGAGHLSNLEVPDQFSTALSDFLVTI
jgi:3-oxoadipate enol-lactonase